MIEQIQVWEVAVVGYLKAEEQNLLRNAEENHGNPSITIASNATGVG
jgi:hypothetical protein